MTSAVTVRDLKYEINIACPCKLHMKEAFQKEIHYYDISRYSVTYSKVRAIYGY